MEINIEWCLGPHFPDLIKGGAIGVVDNCVVYAGGCSWPWRERETGWWLNPAEGEWRPLPPMPEGRAYTSGVTTGNSLYVIGGRKRTGGQFGVVHRNCWRLSRKDGAWRWDVLPELRQARALPSLASVGNVIYCIGGGSWITGAFAAESVPIDEYLDLDNLEAGWREMPRCPGRRRVGAYITSAAGKVYVFGGYYVPTEKFDVNDTIVLGDAWCFDPEAWKWHEVAQLPVVGHTNGGAVTYGDRYIILVGGAPATKRTGEKEGSWEGWEAYVIYEDDPKRGVRVGWYGHKVFVYDVEKDSYEELSEPLPYPTNDPEVAILGDTIYAIGGENCDLTTSATCAHVRMGKVLKIRKA